MAVTVLIMPTVCQYTRTDSPYVWLKWNDADSGTIKYENTKIRPDDEDATRRINRRKHAISGNLIEGAGVVGSEAWHLWVPDWFNTVYRNKKSTRTKYKGKWRFLSRFMAENEIPSPRAFTRQHVYDYIDWRQDEVKEKSGRSPKLNTALDDIRLLRMVLNEAIRRKFLLENVTLKHKIGRDDVEEKPELTDEQITLVRVAVKKEIEWMAIAFEIALLSGLRHQDTQIRRENVNFSTGEITIPHPKGGKRKAFTHAASDTLLAFLKQIFSDGRRVTWTMPPGTLPGLVWRKFLDGINLPSPVCFHATRVTYISRGARAGVPESVMCEQVNHADPLVHRIYKRMTTAERRQFANAVQLPARP